MSRPRMRAHYRFPSSVDISRAGSEDEDDGTALELDEQEQEELIERLRRRDLSNNAIYANFFLALPLLLVTPFTYLLATSSTTTGRLASLLSLTSLLATAYVFKFVLPSKMTTVPSSILGYSIPQRFFDWTGDESPLNRHLPLLNTVICVFLAGLGVWQLSRQSVRPFAASVDDQGFLWLVPGVTYSIIILAQRIMRSVNIDSLEDLKYRYKGV